MPYMHLTSIVVQRKLLHPYFSLIAFGAKDRKHSGALRLGLWLLRLHYGKIWINFMTSEEV